MENKNDKRLFQETRIGNLILKNRFICSSMGDHTPGGVIGFGYTTFEYSNPSISFENGKFIVKVDVKNTGKHLGKEVVQLYVAAPDNKAKNKPSKELKAFAKTRELKPGETETITMTFASDDLASFDEQTSSWVVDAGNYEFQIGASSRDIRHKLSAEVKENTKKVNDILAPKTALNLLKR